LFFTFYQALYSSEFIFIYLLLSGILYSKYRVYENDLELSYQAYAVILYEFPPMWKDFLALPLQGFLH